MKTLQHLTAFVAQCGAPSAWMAAGARVARVPAIRVGLCSGIEGLQAAVERAFAERPALAGRHELSFEEISGPGACPDILLADPGRVAPIVDSLNGLRWMQSTWAGVNALAGTARRDYACTRLAGCFGPQMTEYVLGAIMAEDWRRLRARQDRAQWDPEPFKKRRRLAGATLGCLGVGEIAADVARGARALGMSTIGFATRVREVDAFESITTDLGRVLRDADVIVSVLPSTPSTRGLLDEGRLSACGKGKLLINVGRGDVVSEESLLEALAKGWLQHAVLDVFAQEPLPASSALWKHPSVTVTPHIAAVTYPEDAARAFVENLELWLEDRPLRYSVDLARGY